jgi:hypothetical protein
MTLYLRHDLIKGAKGSAKPEKAKQDRGAKTGEQRGGKYVARIQTGYEKDGSPRYKYFQTLAERDKYLQGRGKTEVDGKKRLKGKLDKEQSESKKKEKASHGKVESGKLFVPKNKESKDKKEEETKKSLPVFIWRLE